MTTRRRVALMGLVALGWAAVDTQLTWAEHAWRPQDTSLPLQAVLGWTALAALAFWPARWLSRRLGAPMTCALVVCAAPVALHQAVRDAARRAGLVSPEAGARLLLAALAVAALLLAGRWIERRLARRRLGWPAALLLLLLAVAALVPGVTGPRPDPHPLDDRLTAPDGRSNLLLLVWDTTRADRLDPYLYDRDTTPNLGRLASRGAVFESSWSSSVFTLSSHVSMLTGLPPALHGTSLRQQLVVVPTLAYHLKRMGYRTGAVVGTSVLAGGAGLERDFDLYDDRVDPPVCDTRLWAVVHDVQAQLAAWVPALRGNGLPHWFQDFQRPAADVFDAALDFARDDDRRPWFLFVNVFDAHWPYLPGPEASERFVRPYDGPLDGYLFRSDRFPAGHVPDEEDRRHVSDLYDAELWQLDRDVDRFLQAIDVGRGDVAVVMTGDHGEGLGEAGTWSHEHLHGPQTRVPLVVYAPGRVAPGTRVAANVSGSDVAPTLLALAGVPRDRLREMDMGGESLLDASALDEREVYVCDYDNPDPSADSHAVIRGRFKLLLRGGQATLHDVIDDPLDRVDIWGHHPDLAAELKARLETLLESAPEIGGRIENLDVLKALGYLGR